MLTSRIIRRTLTTKQLSLAQFQRFSNDVATSETKKNTDLDRFNTFKDLPNLIKETDLDPEKETSWQKADERELNLREKRKRELSYEYRVVGILTFYYFAFQDVFTFMGIHIREPEFAFLDYFKKKENKENNEVAVQKSTS